MASVMEARRRILLNTPHIETASGGVANFKTDMIAPLKECKINFLPKQSGSGDPSPTNIRPISGWDGMTVTRCGKNLFSGTERDTLYPVHIPVGTKVAASVKGINSGVRYYDKDRVRIDYWTLSYTPSFDSSRRYNTFTIINRDCEYFEFYGGTSPTDMQVEIIPSTSSTPTAYEPHTASTFPISWTQQGTVYGGYVDLVSGELVAEWEFASGRWGDIRNDSPNQTTGFYVGYLNFNNTIIAAHAQSKYGVNSICNILNTIRWNGGSITPEHYYTGNPSSIGKGRAYIYANYDDDLMIQMVAKLATPVRYQLTPTQIKALKGINNIYSDADSAEVKFWTH